MEVITSLVDACQRALTDKGRLATAIPGFISRPQQTELAAAIAQALLDKDILVAEAGTGTGKTFAYLLPCLLSGKKALISTATKTLQDQLFQKDLPLLIRALGLSTRIQNLKGRANYICRHRVALFAEEGQFQTPECAHEVAYVHEKLSQMIHGDRTELPEIAEDSTAWPYVTSTTENCLGSECPDYEDCFLVKARRRAMDADVVVINHHLFFADTLLKREGFGELLPGMDVVVFDEAHQLAEIATHFHGQRIGTRQFRDLIDDIISEWPALDMVNQPLKSLSHRFDVITGELLGLLPAREERVSWQGLQGLPKLKSVWGDWMALKDEFVQLLQADAVEEAPGLKRCRERLLELNDILCAFAEAGSETIRWVERFKHTVVFHQTPFDVSEHFSSQLKRQTTAYVFTSATLTMAQSFDCFCKPLGLHQVQTLLLTSPFDYPNQALLYLPRGMPDTKDAYYYERLLENALPIIEALQGRCFMLFTSHKALKQVAQLLLNRLDYPLLIQGDEAKPILLERFRQLGNAVLLGTATFWEGVDVKGEALSCVIIDKLPFANPSDPVVRGRMAYFKDKGLSGFDEISLPNAVIALKQGVGRLIRDIADRGVLMIADPRLTGREYGRHIIASLPSIPITRDKNRVLTFINELALEEHEELVSD